MENLWRITMFSGYEVCRDSACLSDKYKMTEMPEKTLLPSGFEHSREIELRPNRLPFPPARAGIGLLCEILVARASGHWSRVTRRRRRMYNRSGPVEEACGHCTYIHQPNVCYSCLLAQSMRQTYAPLTICFSRNE
jgi:hypothetical protein